MLVASLLSLLSSLLLLLMVLMLLLFAGTITLLQELVKLRVDARRRRCRCRCRRGDAHVKGAHSGLGLLLGLVSLLALPFLELALLGVDLEGGDTR